MFEVVEKKFLNEKDVRMKISAPLIAKKYQVGQFIMLRINENGERIPLTISDIDKESGTVTIVFQAVGSTTMQLATLNTGDTILDFVGPLGRATELEGYKKAIVIGGGLGTAIAYPCAKKLHEMGAHVTTICGFKNKDIIIMEEDMRKVSNECYMMTDDGSNGNKGFVTEQLKKLLDASKDYDLVIAIGPIIMMKILSEMTAGYGIKTIVSLNPIMIDGTGMCGGCRVLINGEVKFACVDGPDFDGHSVDYNDLMRRAKKFQSEEALMREKHVCKLGR